MWQVSVVRNFTELILKHTAISLRLKPENVTNNRKSYVWHTVQLLFRENINLIRDQHIWDRAQIVQRLGGIEWV